jgi:hypothetical protein
MSARRSRTAFEEHLDEAVGLSGWLYTDLLLGLTVVFLALAPITFLNESDDGTPELLDEAGSEGEDGLSEELLGEPVEEEEPLEARCKGLAPEDGILRLELDESLDDQQFAAAAETRIREALDDRQYPTNSQFGFVIAFGQGPSTQLGAARATAERLTDRLHALLPERFESASVRNYWSGSAALSPVVELELFPWIDTCGEPSGDDEAS